jgi:hypothetical protein
MKMTPPDGSAFAYTNCPKSLSSVSTLTKGQAHDRNVVQSRQEFCNGMDIMTCCSKRSNHSKVAAFIGKEAHRLTFGPLPRGGRTYKDRFLMSHGIGGVPNRSLDICLGQTGVGIEQVGLCRTFAKLSKKQLNRNTCAADNGLAQHHFRVHLNPIRHGHRQAPSSNRRSAYHK